MTPTLDLFSTVILVLFYICFANVMAWTTLMAVTFIAFLLDRICALWRVRR